MKMFARQGDLVFEENGVSGEFKRSRRLTLAGRETAPHTLIGAVEYAQSGTVYSLRVGSKPVTVEHAGRHNPVVLPAGWTGTASPLRERGDQADRDVED